MIRKFPDSFLRKKAAKVNKVTEKHGHILSDMLKTMYLNQGVGLAATQVGLALQLVVIDIGTGPIKLINPTVLKRRGIGISEEGCLSVPGTCVKIKRAKTVDIAYLDETGEAQHLKCEGLLARAVQHEIDHLCGKLIIDYLNPVKRLFLKKGK